MALTAGALSQVSVTSVGDVLASAVATMGTSPYTYQWYRSITSGFTPGTGNILAGKTSLNISDSGLLPKTTYYYKVVATDSAGTPAHATSAQLAITTLAPSNSVPISNVINVSVATPQTGVGAYNTSNLAIFTRESYGSGFGTDGYKIYLTPTEVADDFGTSSETYKMAVAIFSQQPNILAANGYLVVIPMLNTAQIAVQEIVFAKAPVSGTFVLNYNGNPSAAINFDDTASEIQAALRLVSGLSSVTVEGEIADGLVSVTFVGVSGPAPLMTVTSNSLLDVDGAAVVPAISTSVIGATAETLDQAIIRTQGLVQYFGIMTSEILASDDVALAAAALVQSLNKLLLLVYNTEASVNPGGIIDLIRTGSLTQTRGLYYGDDLSAALIFMGSYSGLGFSTNFNGSNTTQTMHLKTLSGVQPDPLMTQTLLNKCQVAGADVYVSIRGVPKVFCSGANDFFDNQYNLQWFAGAIVVSEFNVLAQTNTKVPQTENGMNQMKGAARIVCEQGLTNGFLSPGVWTSPTTFGNQVDLLSNVLQRGYYIYSVPVAQQLPAFRALRQAPLIQIAIKYAGAIHKASIIINVNP